MQLWRTPVSLYTLCQSSLASNHTEVPDRFSHFLLKTKPSHQYLPLFFQVWTNPFLQWNPQDYEGIDRILVDPRTIWVPDIVLENKLVYLYFFMRGIAWDDISIQVSTLSLIHSFTHSSSSSRMGHVSILRGCLVTLATCALGLESSYHVLLPNGGLCISGLFVISD